jgi:hypothetical protein
MTEIAASYDQQTITRQNQLGLWSRLIIYQSERFPLHKNGLLIAVFTFASISYSRVSRGESGFVPLPTYIVGAITAILCFALLRIADEFKDHEEDCAYRPYRAVPRGLISLKELSLIGGAIIIFVIALNTLTMPRVLPALLAVLAFTSLMYKEFFIRDWLKRHPMTYMVSHMIFMPLVDIYTTGLDWLNAGVSPANTLIYFLIVSFLNGVIIEIGRKMRAPQQEEPGVETYTAIYGIRSASYGLIAVIAAAAVCAIFAASTAVSSIFVMALFSIAALVLMQFVRTPTAKRAKLIENLTGVWVVSVYLLLGLLPMLVG